jgi:hypothetical protein
VEWRREAGVGCGEESLSSSAAWDAGGRQWVGEREGRFCWDRALGFVSNGDGGRVGKRAVGGRGLGIE